MAQYDAANTGYAPNERGPRNTPRELWRSDAGAALTGSTAVVDGVAYTADEAGMVRALDAASGTERWAVSLDTGSATSPVVTGDTVYVTAGESLYALDVSDGAERWVDTIGADPSTPITADGLVFVTGGNAVHAFAPDGTAATTADLRGDVVSTPAVDGSTLYAATDAGTVYAFDTDQSNGSVTFTEQWTTGTVIDRRPTVTVSDGILIITGASPGQSEQGRVYALDADTGEELWEFTATNWIESAAAIDDDTVYVGVDNGDIVALAAESGTERWRFNANDSWSFLYWGPGVTGGPVVTDDTVYVGSEDNNLYAIDAASGTEQWRFTTDDAIVSTPTVVDGIAFIGSTDGALYAITSPETAPVPLDAGTPGDDAGTGDTDRNTGDSGFLGFSLAGGARGLITSPVTLLVLTIGLVYGIATIALNDSDESDAAPTSLTVEDKPVPASGTDSPSPVTTDSGTADDSAASKRSELLDELRELDRKWSEIDRTLLYSVGDHHPDEYEATFGSLDAALAAAGVTDTVPVNEKTGDASSEQEQTVEKHADDSSPDDTGRDEDVGGDAPGADAVDSDSMSTTPPTATSEQATPLDSTDMTDVSPNELAELYVAFDRFQQLLAELAAELDTDGTTPMERWAEAVADHWGGSGPAGAPNYGVQQRDRNDFSIRDYRDVHGDGDRVTDFQHVKFAPVDDRIQHLLGDAVDDWDHAVPVAPESDTPLPVAISSTEALDTAVELLDEFPAYPDADRPAPGEPASDTDTATLPDGRVDTLTVTVLNQDRNPGSKRDARLRVELEDGTEMPLDIWTTHELSLDWTVGATYQIEQARHKSWETDTGTGHQLSSTKDFRVTPTDAGSTSDKPDANPPKRTSNGAGSTATRSENTGSSGGMRASNSEGSTTKSSATPSRGELRNAIQRVAETIDRPLKASDLTDVTEYSVNDVTRVFGSWQNGLAAAGVDNEARLIDDLHRVADEIGHRPTTTDMNERGHVSATTYATYFGTYTAAIERAFDEKESTRSPTGTDTTSQTDAADTGANTTTGAANQETGSNDRDISNAEGTETSPDDDGILGDIMNDFDEFSDSEAE